MFKSTSLKLKRPELDAMLVGQSIAQQIEGSVNFKRAIKMALRFYNENGCSRY